MISPAGRTIGRPISRTAGRVQLVLCIIVMAVVWCIALPRIAALPAVRDHTDWLDQKGIDPSAMYYTELPAMEPILQRLERPTASPATRHETTSKE